AELARAHQAHADHLAQVLAQRSQSADPPAAAGDLVEMRAALLEQASTQHKANEAVADNIDTLTSVIADLGHTVGTLAVAAAQKAQHAHRSVPVAFPPPRALTTVHAAAPEVDFAANSPGEPPATITASAESSHPGPANSGPPAAPSVPTSSEATPAAAARSLADAITSESPQPRAIEQMLQEAADRAHIHGALDNDDDGDLETAPADDDPERRPPLPSRPPPGSQSND
ncbi:MAG: hypothetical protein H0T76_24435, partial [Nannocystis sp.]